MSYISNNDLKKAGFKYLGTNVKISDKASIYNANQIEIGDNSRIDDFCILSGKIVIGSYCHITPMCLIAGGEPGIYIEDFCTLAYGVKLFAQSDDYSGRTMTNSLIPNKYKNEIFSAVTIRKFSIIGTNAVVMPGVTIDEGCSIGALALVVKSTAPWGIYVGCPAQRLKERKMGMLDHYNEFIKELNNAPL